MTEIINRRTPDFNNLLSALRCERPSRPVLFELFMNTAVYERLAGRKLEQKDALEELKLTVEAFCAAGYDYASAYGSDIRFKANEKPHLSTTSLNGGAVIFDRKSYDSYEWPRADKYDYSRLELIEEYLPPGMKLMVIGPGGVLENVIRLVGYDNLCYMIYDDPELAGGVFDRVGSILVDYYEICMKYDSVGLLMGNDDWGFNTQTFLSVEMMRKYVFPWHKKIVKTAHRRGKPAALHSCGNLAAVMEDVIEDLKYDGKHSFEDNIMPVEQAYEKWGGRIAILGGIDVGFLMREPAEAITARCEAMLALSREKGGYALGSGNSIPKYVPYDKYMAMVSAAHSK